MLDTQLELKSCPFCGADAELLHYNHERARSFCYVSCTGCGVQSPLSGINDNTADGVVDHWNHRAPQPLPDDIRKAIKRVKGFAARYQPACDVDTAWLLQLDFERIDAWFAQQPETQPPTARGE